MAKTAFISHISEEAEVAKALKEVLSEDFLQMLDIFVSSDSESVAAGELWLTAIENAISECAMHIILCSSTSIERPWINFEAGAAWIRRIPVIPVCHSGLDPHRLPLPLLLWQGIVLDDPSGLRRLYARVAAILACGIPRVDLAERAAKLGSYQIAQKPASRTDAQPIRPAPMGTDHTKPILARLNQALEHPNNKWRSLDRVAIEAAVSPEAAAEFLRSHGDFRFSKGKSGRIIVGLRSRVDPTRMRGFSSD